MSEIEHASDEDIRIAKRNALEQAGCTEDELRAQAATGHFASIEARLAWMLLRRT